MTKKFHDLQNTPQQGNGSLYRRCGGTDGIMITSHTVLAVIRQRETYDEMLARDRIPPWLNQ